MKSFVHKRSNRTKACLATIFAFCLSAPTYSQTLARPGWVGSGMSTESWFRHAVVYRLNVHTFASAAAATDGAPGTLKGLTERLDYLRNLGVDAMLLEPLAAANEKAPINPGLGSVEDFDELSLEASKRNLRIILTLPKPDAGLARYWLTRGVAGFYVAGPSNAPELQGLRKLLPTFVGQRILITDADLSSAAGVVKSPANELQLDSALLKLSAKSAGAASQLRAALEASQALQHSGTPSLATDAPNNPRSIDRFAPAAYRESAGRLLATVLLLNRSVPLLYAGQELGLTAPVGTATMIPWGKPPAPEPETPVEAAATPAPAPPPPAPSQETANFVASERYVPYVPPVKPVAPPKPAPLDPASVAGQELNADSLLRYYRQLIQLHHGRSSVRDGDEIFLNHDDANALIFVRRPENPSLTTPPLVVLCNLSAKPLHLSIKSELTNLHLRGSFLRTVLLAEGESVSMNLDAVFLPAFGVYIGELRY